jgi:hypothetical protein
MTITVSDARLPQFRDALVAAFDEAELDDLVLGIPGGRRLDRITTSNGLDAKALDVVRWANRFGQLVDLFEHALQQRPNDQSIEARYNELREFAARLPQVADPYLAWELRTGAYFVDRLSLRETIRANLGYPQGRRVLVLSGPSGSGKTYSVSFLQHIRDESAIWVVPIDLEEFVIGGQLNLEEICKKIAIQIGLLSLENSEQLSRLSSFFGSQLVAYLENKQKECWIVFDSFNKPGILIPQSITEFILGLVKLSTQSTTRLRIVLLGLRNEDELMRKVRANAVREDLGAVDDEAFIDFFERLCEHLQRTRQIACDERAVAEAIESVTAARDTGEGGAFERQWDALLIEIERLHRPLRTTLAGGAR